MVLHCGLGVLTDCRLQVVGVHAVDEDWPSVIEKTHGFLWAQCGTALALGATGSRAVLLCWSRCRNVPQPGGLNKSSCWSLRSGGCKFKATVKATLLPCECWESVFARGLSPLLLVASWWSLALPGLWKHHHDHYSAFTWYSPGICLSPEVLLQRLPVLLD